MMATRLRRPVTRSIGDLLVRVTETHVEVRRKRHKKGVRVALSELVAAVDQVRPPRGWIPRTGDSVAVLPWRHRARVAAVIPAVPETLVRIRFKRGTERIVELGRLVPVSETMLVACERIPKDPEPEPGPDLFRSVGD